MYYHAPYQVRQRTFTINEADREQWVDNDEGLYRWWKSTRQSKRQFVRENREQLNTIIRKACGQD